MIDLNHIKTILQVAGITHLKIQFNDAQKHVTADYVFKGVSGTKRITYQEIIDGFTIGLPEPAQCATMPSDSLPVDEHK